MALEGAPRAPEVHGLEVVFATWFLVELVLRVALCAPQGAELGRRVALGR